MRQHFSQVSMYSSKLLPALDAAAAPAAAAAAAGDAGGALLDDEIRSLVLQVGVLQQRGTGRQAGG